MVRRPHVAKVRTFVVVPAFRSADSCHCHRYAVCCSALSAVLFSDLSTPAVASNAVGPDCCHLYLFFGGNFGRYQQHIEAGYAVSFADWSAAPPFLGAGTLLRFRDSPIAVATIASIGAESSFLSPFDARVPVAPCRSSHDEPKLVYRCAKQHRLLPTSGCHSWWRLSTVADIVAWSSNLGPCSITQNFGFQTTLLVAGFP